MFDNYPPWRRAIQTIIAETYKHITAYTPPLQTVLTEFLDLFKWDYLNNLSAWLDALASYYQKYQLNNELGYYSSDHFAFLRFSTKFVELIRRSLSWYGETLIFIRHILRGVFLLLKNTTPLTDVYAWEPLQYWCYRLYDSYLSNLFLVHFPNGLKITYYLSMLENDCGLGALNPNRINQLITRHFEPRHGQNSREERIRLFFDMTGMLWHLNFYHLAFFVSWMIIQLEMVDPNSLLQFLDISNTQTSAITSISHLFSSKNRNTVFGRVAFPTGTTDEFVNKLTEWNERRGKGKIVKCQEIIDYQETVSYLFLNVKKGWRFPPLKEDFLNGTDDGLFSYNAVFETKSWNQQWSCADKSNIIDYIELYCKYLTHLKYNDLNRLFGNVFLNQEWINLFGPVTDLMWDLYDQRVMQLVLIPRKQLSFYSYFLIPPDDFSNQCEEKVRKMLPYSVFYSLKDGKKLIFTPLDKLLKKFLEDELNFQVFSLIPLNIPHRPQVGFFETNL